MRIAGVRVQTRYKRWRKLLREFADVNQWSPESRFSWLQPSETLASSLRTFMKW